MLSFRHLVVIIAQCFFLSVAHAVLFCDRPELGKNRLIQLIVVTRHGFRTPTGTYPNDRYQESFWSADGGFGQLTRRGIHDQFELGQWVRHCYPGLDLSRPRIRAFSTDYDRTIMSAQSFLAGLSTADPQGFVSNEVDTLQQMMAPVHRLPSKTLPASAICQDQWCGDEDAVMAEVHQEDSKHREVLEYLAKNAGLNSSAYLDVGRMADPVRVERASNLPLDDWLANNSAALELLGKIEDFVSQLNYRNSLPLRTLVAASPLLNFIVDWMRNATASYQDPATRTKYPNFVLISGHDTTVSPVLAGLGDFNGLLPPLCSAVLIEITTESETVDPTTGALQVSVYFRNDSTSEPYAIRVRNGCGQKCSFDKFALSLAEAMKPVAVEESPLSVLIVASVIPSDIKVGLFVFVVFCAVSAGLVVAAILSCSRRRRKILYRLNQSPGWPSTRRTTGGHWQADQRVLATNDDFFSNDLDEDDEFGDENTLLMMQMPSGSSTNVGDSTRMPLLMSDASGRRRGGSSLKK